MKAEAKVFEDKFMSVLSKLEKVRNHLSPSQIKWLEYLEIMGSPLPMQMTLALPTSFHLNNFQIYEHLEHPSFKVVNHKMKFL